MGLFQSFYRAEENNENIQNNLYKTEKTKKNDKALKNMPRNFLSCPSDEELERRDVNIKKPIRISL